MVGRLAAEQALTLYTTPVIYILFDNLAQRFTKKPNKPATGDRETGRAHVNSLRTFIQRPVATTLLTLAIALAGAVAFGGAAGVAPAGG